MKKELFIVIDSHSLIHRAYHALPRLSTHTGELTNAVFGFSSVLLKALKDFKPDYLVAAFDVAGPTFRDKEFAEYKATREKAPDELYDQIPLVKKVLAAFNIPIYEHEGFEADDIIGTVARLVEKKKSNVDVLIVSGDLDTLQLITKRVRVYTLKRGVQDTVVYDEAAVKERFGLKPEQLADFKGLRGDPSDNIPGVPGIGEKTASILLQKCKTLEQLYERIENGPFKGVSDRICSLLLEHKEQAFFSRMLATIRLDVPVAFRLSEARWGGFEEDDVRNVFRELNFSTLASRLVEVRGFKNKHEETSPPRAQQLLKEVEDANGAGVISEQLYQLERDLVPVIVAMEERGIRLNPKALQGLEKNVSKRLSAVERRIFKAAKKEFNVNSPKQLSAVLFEDLSISKKGLRKTPGKEISTAAGELEKMRGSHPIIELILQQRELQKVLSTYIKPLPKQMDDEQRIHTTFKPFGTSTGRISSANPNLQNIPMRGELATEIRSAFIPAKGYQFLACDYSQMELRVVAHLAKDENMIETFQRGEDIHASTAAHVFDIPLAEVTPRMRHRAKALNFGLIYGIGERAFARSAGVSTEEAREFMDRYMSIFTGVAAYMEIAKETARERGYAETLFGRKRFLPDLQSKNPRIRAMAERAAINMPAQGTAADIVKMAMVSAEKELRGARMILQIHDELLWEVPIGTESDVAKRAIRILEGAAHLLVPLRVEAKVGDSWGALKGLTPQK